MFPADLPPAIIKPAPAKLIRPAAPFIVRARDLPSHLAMPLPGMPAAMAQQKRILPPLDGLSGITGAWSMARKMLSAYSSSFYTTGTGVSAILDQSGNSRNIAQGTGSLQPAVGTAGPQSRACATFDGTDDFLESGVATSNFITVSTGYIIAACIVVTADSNNDSFFNESGGNMHLFSRTSGPTVVAENWDGNSDTTTGIAYSTGTVIVVEWRHESGTLYCRVNGGSWQSVSSGNNVALNASLRFARGPSSTYFNYRLFEAAAFSAVPSEGQRDALVANMLAYYG